MSPSRAEDSHRLDAVFRRADYDDAVNRPEPGDSGIALKGKTFEEQSSIREAKPMIVDGLPCFCGRLKPAASANPKRQILPWVLGSKVTKVLRLHRSFPFGIALCR
jgi:hypothetical protein